MNKSLRAEEDRKILRSAFGSVAGQKALFLIHEMLGYQEQAKSEQDQIKRNIILALRKSIGLGLTEEDREIVLKQELKRAFEVDIQDSEGRKIYGEEEKQ